MNFGPDNHSDEIAKYLDKYVIVATQDGATNSGKLIEIVDNSTCIVMQPHTARVYDENGVGRIELVDRRSMFNFQAVIRLGETTEHDIKCWCNEINQKETRTRSQEQAQSDSQQ